MPRNIESLCSSPLLQISWSSQGEKNGGVGGGRRSGYNGGGHGEEKRAKTREGNRNGTERETWAPGDKTKTNCPMGYAH